MPGKSAKRLRLLGVLPGLATCLLAACAHPAKPAPEPELMRIEGKNGPRFQFGVSTSKAL